MQHPFAAHHRSSARNMLPEQSRATIVSLDPALVAAARRVFVCHGILVSVYRDLESYYQALDTTTRRPSYLVVDLRGEKRTSGRTTDRLSVPSSRGGRVMIIVGTGHAPESGERHPYVVVRVTGDYAPVSSTLQSWLADRAERESATGTGMITIDDEAHEVLVDGRRLALRPIEHALLRLFLENPHHLYSRADLLRLLWGGQGSVELRTVDVHVMRLRKVLRAHGLEGFIETVFGFGYRANHDALQRPRSLPSETPPSSFPPSPRNTP